MQLPTSLTAVLEQQRGVFTTRQALAAGLTGTELGRARAGGTVVRLRRGAYTTAETWREADDRARHRLMTRAVWLQLPAPAVISHLSAVVLHGLPVVDAPLTEVHVTRPGPVSASRHQAGVWHHVNGIDATCEVEDMRATGLAQTVADHARTSSERSALVVADAALARGLEREQLLDLVDRTKDHPGSIRARRMAALADGRSESPGETISRLAFAAVGLAPDELQWEIATDQGTKRADFAWTRAGLVAEFDGRVKYGRLLRPGQNPEDVVLAERARELAIERAGWTVERFTWAEVHDLRLVRRRLLEAFARAESRRLRTG